VKLPKKYKIGSSNVVTDAVCLEKRWLLKSIFRFSLCYCMVNKFNFIFTALYGIPLKMLTSLCLINNLFADLNQKKKEIWNFDIWYLKRKSRTLFIMLYIYVFSFSWLLKSKDVLSEILSIFEKQKFTAIHHVIEGELNLTFNKF
jgi:hypothetical protein